MVPKPKRDPSSKPGAGARSSAAARRGMEGQRGGESERMAPGGRRPYEGRPAILASLHGDTVETRELAETLGMWILAEVLQPRSKPHGGSFVGPGKLRAVRGWVRTLRRGQIPDDWELEGNEWVPDPAAGADADRGDDDNGPGDGVRDPERRSGARARQGGKSDAEALASFVAEQEAEDEGTLGSAHSHVDDGLHEPSVGPDDGATRAQEGRAQRKRTRARDAGRRYRPDDDPPLLLVLNEDVKPSILFNLEDALGIEVWDRTRLILEIFSAHANIKEARLQVELAKLQYEVPLVKEAIHRKRSGERPGFRGGGEYAVADYQDFIKRRMTAAKSELERIRKEREVRRSVRKKGFYLVSLAGYTNAGKSSLLNRLTGSEVLSKWEMFSTLATTTRRMVDPKPNRASRAIATGGQEQRRGSMDAWSPHLADPKTLEGRPSPSTSKHAEDSEQSDSSDQTDQLDGADRADRRARTRSSSDDPPRFELTGVRHGGDMANREERGGDPLIAAGGSGKEGSVKGAKPGIPPGTAPAAIDHRGPPAELADREGDPLGADGELGKEAPGERGALQGDPLDPPGNQERGPLDSAGKEGGKREGKRLDPPGNQERGPLEAAGKEGGKREGKRLDPPGNQERGPLDPAGKEEGKREGKRLDPLGDEAGHGDRSRGHGTPADSALSADSADMTIPALESDSSQAPRDDPFQNRYQRPVLLTDTVGFIAGLPSWLLDAFHSTLEEISVSDVVLLVVDISDDLETLLDKVRICKEELSFLDVTCPVLVVLNKTDLVPDGLIQQRIDALVAYRLARPHEIIPVSCASSLGLGHLRDEIDRALPGYIRYQMALPMDSDGQRILSCAYDWGWITGIDYRSDIRVEGACDRIHWKTLLQETAILGVDVRRLVA